MTAPDLPPLVPPRPNVPVVNPSHARDYQGYAVEQERQRHNDALYALGEYAVFILLWHIDDLKAGRVDRCPRCFKPGDLISEVYKQPMENKCEFCYGTTFEGGYKAILVRPSIWDTNEEDYRVSGRGEMTVQTASVQSTSDFRMRTGDYIARQDGARFQMRTMASNELRTGFAMPTAETSVLGYNYGTVSREDESTVAYLMPPSPDTVRYRLHSPHGSISTDFTDIEVIRGPVLV